MQVNIIKLTIITMNRTAGACNHWNQPQFSGEDPV